MRLFFLTFLMPMVLFAEIITVQTIEEVKPYFEGADEHTLGVFDVDETLLISSEHAFHRPNMQEHREAIREIIKGASFDDKYMIMMGMLTHTPSILIEEQAPAFLSELQKRGIKLVALTGAGSGYFGEIHVPTMRCEELKKQGIDFSTSFPHLKEKIFTGLKEERGNYPVYSQGVLYVNGDATINATSNTKGEVLLEFFDAVEWTPKKVIFVDDNIHYLEHVEKTLADLSIEFIGLHYHGAKQYPTEKVDRDKCCAQWRALVEKTQQVEKGKRSS